MGDCCAVMNCHCMAFYSGDEQCHPMCHHMSICQSRKLLQGPLTEKFYEEHVNYLTTFVNDSKDGFYVNDLMHLNRVLEMLSKRLETTPAYVPIFEKMLQICSIPPLLHDTLESLTGLVHLADYMTVLGLLPTWFCNHKFQLVVYKALSNLLINVKPMNIAYSSVGYRYIAIENSYLPEIITQKLESVVSKEYDTILNICLQLTNISDTVCRKMVEANAINFLLLRLIPKTGTSPKLLNIFAESKEFSDKLNITCAILTNLVESLTDLDKSTLEKLAPDPELIWIIRYILRGIVGCQSHKQCRNNLMDFLLLCLNTFPYVHFVECNLFDDMAFLSVATELDTSNTWAKDVEFTNDDYDILFKKMLLTSLCFIHKYETLHMIFENRNVIAGLLKIISPEYQTNWHPDTHESMKKYALIALYNIVPRLINNFLAYNGPQSLLILIETYIMDPSEGNKEILEKSLKCLTKFTETKNEFLLEDTRKHGGISMLTLLCNNILQKSIITSFDQQALVYSFCILGRLYSKHPLPKDTSIILITKYLNRILKPKRDDSYIDTRAVICAIDFLWEIIRYDHDKLMIFMKMEGVYLLLDVIQMSPFPVQVIGLGCLIDLCDEGLCIPYLLTWRGGENKKQIFFSLLADIFRTECKKIETSLDENDVIMNTEYPLMGKLQYNEAMSLKKDANSSPALLDLFGSARPKVYAMLQLLKIRYKDKVELTNEHYRICSMPITVKDKVILHLAENFFALKLAEAWKELSRDLVNSNIQPVFIDAQMLNILTEKMQKWNENVQQEQLEIIKHESQKEANEESKLYDKMKKYRLGQAIDALRELRYFAKISNTMFRLAQKQRQQKEIEDSLTLPVDSKCNMHRTYMDQIDVTSIFHLKYNLAYN